MDTFRSILCDNEKEAEELVAVRSQLHFLMETCFNTVNSLTERYQDHMPSAVFPPIAYVTSRTLQTNCNILMGRLNEVSRFVENETQRFEALLKPEVFQSFVGTVTRLDEKIGVVHHFAQKGLVMDHKPMGVALLGYTSAKNFIQPMIASLSNLMRSALATTNVGTLLISQNIAAKQIFKILHSNELQEMMHDLKANLTMLQAASDEFYHNVKTITGQLTVFNGGVSNMAMKDLFFPENSQLRDEVIRLSTTLFELLKSNFKTTNKLIDCIHEYIPGQHFSKITMDVGETIRVNCDVLVHRMQEIQDYIQDTLRRVEEKVETEEFKKLTDVDVSFQKRIDTAQSIFMKLEAAGFAVTSGVGIALAAKISIGNLSTITGIIVRIGTCVLSTLAVGVLILAVDAIFSAILGAIEKSKLKSAISELNSAVSKFEPESDKFNDTIYRIIFRVRAQYGR